jgi:hypothetical protein
MRQVLLGMIGAAVVATAAEGQERQVMTVDDLMRLATVSDVRISPDGGRVLYVVSTPDVFGNQHLTDVWMVAAEGGHGRGRRACAADEQPEAGLLATVVSGRQADRLPLRS